jgi:hypothetical protein
MQTFGIVCGWFVMPQTTVESSELLRGIYFTILAGVLARMTCAEQGNVALKLLPKGKKNFMCALFWVSVSMVNLIQILISGVPILAM